MLTPDAALLLMDRFEQAEDDDSVRLLAITGTGARFCGGFEPEVSTQLVESLAVLSKPTLAIVNGDAIDEGLELAMAADIRVGIAKARFALTQLQRGELPHYGGTQRLPRLAGASNALRMILAGATIDGTEAHRIGLLSYLAGHERELARVAGSVIEAIFSRAPLATRIVPDAALKG